jgi:hypothetical protein
MTMNKQTITLAIAGAISAVLVGSAPASWAAPVSSSMTAFKQGTLSDVTDVRYYRHHYYGRRYYNPGAAIGLGILGAAAGAAAAAASPGYYYGPGYYGRSYGYYGNPYRRDYYYPY